MKPRTTLVLAVLLLIVGAVIFFWERHLPGSDASRAREKLLFADLSSETVREIAIRDASTTVVIRRDDMRWRIVEPIDDLADRAAVDKVIRALAEVPRSTAIPASEIAGGDEATGLGSHALRVTIDTDDSESVDFSIGAHELPGGQRYLRLAASDDLLIIPAALPARLEIPVDAWRHQRLSDFSSLDVRRVHVVSENLPAALTFERRQGDYWWLSGALEDEVDARKFGDWLSRMLALEIEDFLPPDEDIDDAFESKATWRIVLDLDPRSRPADREHRVEMRFFRSSRYDHIFRAVVSDRAGSMRVRAASLLARIEQAPAAWRSMTVLDFTPWDVGEFEIRDRDQVLTVTRIGDRSSTNLSWLVEENEHSPAKRDELSNEKINAFLSRIARTDALRIDDGIDEKSAGLAPPARTLILRFFGDDRPPWTLDLGRSAEDGGTYLRRHSRPAIFILRSDDADAMTSLLHPAELGPDPG